jgi:hypothetical protein
LFVAENVPHNIFVHLLPSMSPIMRVLAATAVLMMAQLAVPAVAQVAGQSCGSPLYTTGDFQWISVPTGKLAATRGSGAASGANGCATSDDGSYAHVSAELAYGSYEIAAVSFTAEFTGSGVADRSLSILAGDANTTGLVDKLRGPSAEPDAVLAAFSRCYIRRNFTASGKMAKLVCNREVQVIGHWVVFIAKRLKVCNAMLATSQAIVSQHVGLYNITMRIRRCATLWSVHHSSNSPPMVCQ